MPSSPLQSKISAEWDAMAGEWDDLASSYRDCFCAVLERNVLSNYKDISQLTVLDFGCGTGLLAEYLQARVQRVICVDAAKMMVQQCQSKIQARDWNNVEAHCCALADLDNAPTETQQAFEKLKGNVDLILASSVLSFIPEDDLGKTMRVLSCLLKPGTGILFHSDWTKGAEHTNGFTYERAKEIYDMAGLESQSMEIVPFQMGEEQAQVFVGVVAKKK
jgi:2-polyprenyl-3-methyl-5-hydroxy-6-metoxy-1,4-benzoquinol methylase